MANININQYWNECKQIIQQTMDLKNQQLDENELKQISQTNIDLVKDYFKDIIKFIRQHLVLAYDKFYGIMLLDIKIEVDTKLNGAIDVLFNSTQIKMVLNPFYLGQMSIQQIEALIVSELLLIALDIPTKFTDLNPGNNKEEHAKLLRAASALSMDLTLNDIKVIQDNRGMTQLGLKIPSDAYTVSDIRIDTKINAASHQTLEYYYELLSNSCDYSSQGGSSQGINYELGDYDPNLPNMPNNYNNTNDIHKWEDINTRDETQSKITRLVSTAYNSLSEQERGLVPGCISEQIKILLSPPAIKWEREIKNQAGTIRFGKRSTFRKPNRRQPDRLDLPGKMKNRVLRVVIGLDTSGSMSDELIAMSLNEIFGMFKNIKTEITIIECDSSISKQPYIAKSAKDVQTNISGRGGTSFTPVIEYINDHNYRDALFIYFTDGEGESDIPKPKVSKVVWVLPSQKYKLSVKNNYGKVLYLDTDNAFKKAVEDNKYWKGRY